MTATFHPIATRSHRVEVSTPHYGARRAVAVVVLLGAGVLLALAASAFVGAAIGAGGRPAAASGAAPDTAVVRVHVAQPGDTLWSIAERYRGGVDQGRFVDALIDLNGGTAIQVGQAVRLP